MIDRGRAVLLLVAVPVLATAVSAVPVSAQRTDHVARVRALGLDSLPGTVPAYYTAGFRVRAESVQATLEEASAFFAERLGVAPQFRDAVFDEARWAKVRPTAYGVPWASWEPVVVVLPARPERSVVVARHRFGVGGRNRMRSCCSAVAAASLSRVRVSSPAAQARSQGFTLP
ncbi:MAG: hypothetical protein M3373_09635 [Gemmatimonadota bacterium]|nr:hypothetical protein [Gemmatimonadota bacterium]